MRTRSRTALATSVALLLSLAACTGDPEPAPSPEPVNLSWRELTLPMPPGDPGRLVLRDATSCGGRWFVAGGVVGTLPSAAPSGSVVVTEVPSRPAAWTSTDNGRSWTPLTFNPREYYGFLAVLYSVACRDGKLAAIGSKVGGAHSNPRVTTWYQRPDGVMDQVSARFELFGGPNQVGSPRHLAAGPSGWLIAGSRVFGAAVWTSPDATDFTLREDAVELASDQEVETAAADAVASRGGWTVVGGGLREGRIDRDPAVWTSTDGQRWKRDMLPGDDTYEEFQRVVRLGDDPDADLVGVGLRGPTFGAWRAEKGVWTAAGRFGSTGKSGLADARGVAWAGDRVVVSAQDGTAYGLWVSDDRGSSWRGANLPVAQPAGSDRTVAVAGAGRTLLVIADDRERAGIWITDFT